MTVADVVLAQADENMSSAWQTLLGTLAPKPGEVRDSGAVMLSSGLPVPLFNPALVFGAVDDPTATVDRVVRHYTSLEAPFVIYFRDEVTPELADACAAAGLVEHFRPPLMVLDPIPRPPSPPDHLRIEPVTASTLDDVVTVLSEGFGMPRELASFMSRPEVLDIPNLSSFLGVVDGQAVGTAGVFVAAGVAGVYNVATAPAGRGRGVGSAMTWAAIAAGRAAGAQRSILQASEQGAPVYERMGFVTPTRYRQFQPANAS